MKQFCLLNGIRHDCSLHTEQRIFPEIFCLSKPRSAFAFIFISDVSIPSDEFLTIFLLFNNTRVRAFSCLRSISASQQNVFYSNDSIMIISSISAISKGENMNTKTFKHIAFGTLATLVFAIGIPIVINESYKIGGGYYTVWDGTDLLGFYGTLLSQIIAVIILAATFIEERNKDRKSKNWQIEEQRWNACESIICEVTDGLNPYILTKYSLDALKDRNINLLMVHLLSFETDANIQVSKLHGSIETEIAELDLLVKQIDSFKDDVLALQRKFLDWLITSTSVIQNENSSTEEINYHNADIMASFDSLRKETDALCKGKYQQLIESRRSTFLKKQTIISQKIN